MARHELALCTPQTARLYHARMGRRPVLEMPYRQTLAWGGLQLTTYPAGHCLGSAMLLADDGQQSFAIHRRFQTGGFGHGRAGRVAAGRHPGHRIDLRQAAHRHIPRAEAIERLLALVHDVLARG